MASTLLILLGGIIGAGFLAGLLSEKTRIPDALLLIVTGLLLGPVWGVVPTESIRPFMAPFGTIALIIILFEGGLDLDLKRTLRQSGRAVLLAGLSFALALLLTGYALMLGLDLTGRTAWAMAAALACTSGPIVIPTMARLLPHSAMRPLLAVESALSDALSVIIVMVLLSLEGSRPVSGAQFGGNVAKSFLIGGGLAGLGGLIWLWLVSHLSEHPYFYLMTIGFVFLLMGVVESFHGSGALGVLVFGMVLANGEAIAGIFGARVREQVVRRFGSGTLDLHPRITESHAEVSFLTRSFFFVYLGLIFTWPGADFRIWLTIALIAVAVILAREVAVQLTGWTTRVSGADRSLLAAMLPRGLATAVLAAMLASRQPGTSVPWESLATFIIIITNLWMTFRLLRIRTAPAAMAEDGA
ncbi:MAG: cation:proton antiporter [Candidatus Latescibacteria bacterium]|nr:cation:proton antiporter [Candidatus Latescibacterota bacterium]